MCFFADAAFSEGGKRGLGLNKWHEGVSLLANQNFPDNLM